MRRLGRYWYLRLRRRHNPDRMARGLAAGVFVGMFPLFGLQTILGILLSTLVGGDQLLAILGTWVSNPVTDLPLFTFNFYLGRWLSNSDLELIFPSTWPEAVDLGRQILGVWFIGCLVMGTIGAIGSYFAGLYVFRRLARKSKSPY